MGYQATFRIWRGEKGDGALKDYTVEVNDGGQPQCVACDLISMLYLIGFAELTVF